jgi:hypothetical protein
VDELGTDDELRFKEQEERAAKRIELDESSYEASSADDEAEKGTGPVDVIVKVDGDRTSIDD